MQLSPLKMVDECANEFGEILSPADFWSLCKSKIRTFCIEFAKNSNHCKKSKMSHIEKQLHEAYVNITKIIISIMMRLLMLCITN